MKYTKAVLLDWRETAEHFASAEVQGTASNAGGESDEHSLSFKIEDWSIWRNRGNLPSDEFFIVGIWARGDIRYSVRFRLRNNLNHEEVLHRFRMEFMDGANVLLSDESPFDGNDVVLPPGKWVTLDVNYGLHDNTIFGRSKTVWLKAELVGSGEIVRWLVSEINHSQVTFPSN